MSNFIIHFPQLVNPNYYDGEITTRTIEDVQRIWAEVNSMEFDPIDDITEDLPGLGHRTIPFPLDESMVTSTEDIVREAIERALHNMQKGVRRKKLFLDDIRIPEHVTYYKPSEAIYQEDGWDIVANYEEFVEYISNNGLPDLISFDHDLADEHYTPSEYWDDYEKSKEYQESKNYTEKTGKECAEWLVQYVEERKIALPDILVHSQNPVGVERIRNVFKDYASTLRTRLRQEEIARNNAETLRIVRAWKDNGYTNMDV